MKRKKEKVPGFDEIIFENRNRTYGAYDLRKHYKSTTSMSILGGMAIFAILSFILSMNNEDGSASSGPTSVIIILSDPVIPAKVAPPELKPPPDQAVEFKNLRPEVVSDTSDLTDYLPTTEEIIEATNNGSVIEDVITTEEVVPEIPAENKPFIVVEESPEFPGGINALLRYISEHIKYPSDARNNNIQGKVILKFVVNEDGSADRIEILRGVDPVLDNEAIRVVKSLPRFKPGKQGGVPVPVWYTLPVVFKLENR